MRVAVVGNSHLAAYKLAWEVMHDDYQDLELVFFGSPATSIRFLKVKEGALHPTSEALRDNLAWTSQGLESIAGDFDAYILVGMGFSFAHLMALLPTHVPTWAYDASTIGRHLVSADAFNDFMSATLHNSNAMNLVDKLRQVSLAPVIYTPNPLPALGIVDSGKHPDYSNKAMLDRVFDFYSGELPKVATRGCTLFEQPQSTLASKMFTKDTFSRGSFKLKVGLKHPHKEEDMFHMNAEFGRVALSQILSRHLGMTSN